MIVIEGGRCTGEIGGIPVDGGSIVVLQDNTTVAGDCGISVAPER